MGLCLKALAILVILAAASSLTPAPAQGQWWPGPQGIAPLEMVESIIYQFTNEVRGQQGLGPLQEDIELRGIARHYSADMASRRFFSHVSPEGLSLQDRLAPGYPGLISQAGENIWRGSGLGFPDGRLLAKLIMDGWISSPGHRANLLNPAYTYVGIGVAAWGGEIYATQIFIRRQESPQSFGP